MKERFTNEERIAFLVAWLNEEELNQLRAHCRIIQRILDIGLQRAEKAIGRVK